MTGTLSDPAVSNHIVVLTEAHLILVDGLELGSILEGAVIVGGPLPRDTRRPGDVAAPQRSLLGIVRHVQPLAPVLLG